MLSPLCLSEGARCCDASPGVAGFVSLHNLNLNLSPLLSPLCLSGEPDAVTRLAGDYPS